MAEKKSKEEKNEKSKELKETKRKPATTKAKKAAVKVTSKNSVAKKTAKVEKAGKYDLKIQPEHRNSELFVLDAYEIFS